MLILTCSAIFIFSSQNGTESSNLSNDLMIRKLGHFSGYMALGFFAFAYLSNLFMKSYEYKDFKITVLLSNLFSILYAISDEFHQTFVEGRDGNIVDVLIDGSGAFTGIILSCMLYFFTQKKW